MLTSALCCLLESPAHKKAEHLLECSPLPHAVPPAAAPYHTPSAAAVQQRTRFGLPAADSVAATLRYWADGLHSNT